MTAGDEDHLTVIATPQESSTWVRIHSATSKDPMTSETESQTNPIDTLPAHLRERAQKIATNIQALSTWIAHRERNSPAGNRFQPKKARRIETARAGLASYQNKLRAMFEGKA